MWRPWSASTRAVDARGAEGHPGAAGLRATAESVDARQAGLGGGNPALRRAAAGRLCGHPVSRHHQIHRTDYNRGGNRRRVSPHRLAAVRRGRHVSRPACRKDVGDAVVCALASRPRRSALRPRPARRALPQSRRRGRAPEGGRDVERALHGQSVDPPEADPRHQRRLLAVGGGSSTARNGFSRRSKRTRRAFL